MAMPAAAAPASGDQHELLASENAAPQAPAVEPRPAPPPKWNVFERAAYDRETQALADTAGPEGARHHAGTGIAAGWTDSLDCKICRRAKTGCFLQIQINDFNMQG